jgi:hypothetical protein
MSTEGNYAMSTWQVKKSAPILTASVIVILSAALADLYAATPSNPHASSDAIKVLNYFADLPNHSSKRVVSGQQEVPQAVYDATGYWPGFMGLDYYFSQPLARRLKITGTREHLWRPTAI